MKYIHTYEGLFDFFKDNHVEKITKSLSKLLKEGKKGNDYINLMIYNFIYNKFIDNNTSIFYTCMSQSGDIKDIIIKITSEKQWVLITINKETDFINIKEFKYFIHLLDLYGEITKDTKTTKYNSDEYFLTLENADKLINELTIKGLSDFEEIKKYNL